HRGCGAQGGLALRLAWYSGPYTQHVLPPSAAPAWCDHENLTHDLVCADSLSCAAGTDATARCPNICSAPAAQQLPDSSPRRDIRCAYESHHNRYGLRGPDDGNGARVPGARRYLHRQERNDSGEARSGHPHHPRGRPRGDHGRREEELHVPHRPARTERHGGRMIAVGTPSKQNGDADLSYVDAAATELADKVQPGARLVVVNKSTVPVGSA